MLMYFLGWGRHVSLPVEEMFCRSSFLETVPGWVFVLVFSLRNLVLHFVLKFVLHFVLKLVLNFVLKLVL